MKSWHLDRRTFLLGSGVSMALPYMEAMGKQAQAGDLPARMCAMYFPFGILSYCNMLFFSFEKALPTWSFF